MDATCTRFLPHDYEGRRSYPVAATVDARRWARASNYGNRSCWTFAGNLHMETPFFHNALWLRFIDNESAKFSLIKGSSLAVGTNEIVYATWEECRIRRLYPWWERVSSSDNPVDKASRRDLRDLYHQGWRTVEPTLPSLWEQDLNIAVRTQSFQ